MKMEATLKPVYKLYPNFRIDKPEVISRAWKSGEGWVPASKLRKLDGWNIQDTVGRIKLLYEAGFRYLELQVETQQLYCITTDFSINELIKK